MAFSVRGLGTAEGVSGVMAAARIAFLLVGIASTGVILVSTVVPYSADLIARSLPRIRILALSLLSPSYLFVAVHFIILAIWKLQGSNNQMHRALDLKEEIEEVEIQYQMKPSEVPEPISVTISASNPSDLAPQDPDLAVDRPKDGSDLADLGRAIAGEAHETMDATWKAIVEGDAGACSSASRPRMRKSDTWERYGREREYSPPAMLDVDGRFRRSETFRRVSVGREELFGRAEAFIRTQYEQRRMQRQESEQRFIEMVNAAC